MRIIHITASYKPAFIYGGPIMSVAKLCETLTIEKWGDKQLEIEVLTTTANGKEELVVPSGERQIVSGVNVTYFKRLSKDHTHFSPSLVKRLIIEIRRSRSNNKQLDPKEKLVIHIHAWWNLVSIFSCWIAKCFGIPVVLSPRGMLNKYTLRNKNSRYKAFIHDYLGIKLLNYCHIHATSINEKEDILRLVNPKSITIIPNLVSFISDTQVILNQLKVEENTFKLIFLSRIEEKKGLELLLLALREININWSLTIAGSGEKTYLEKLIAISQSLKIADRITWLGQVKDESKFDLLTKNDMLVLTSYNENFANVVVESLSVGTAVMISNEVGLADYVSYSKLGWICELNTESIQKKLMEAFEDQDQRQLVRKNAPSMISHNFNSVNLGRKYVQLYQQL